MTEVAKLARELRVGDTLVLDALPPRIIRELKAEGNLIVVRSQGAVLHDGGGESGSYAETFERDRVVTTEVD